MLPYPDRFRFKSAPPRASRLMFVWFVFLLLVAVLSVGMLVTAIVHAAETDTDQDVRLHDATSGTLLFKAKSSGHYPPTPLLKTDVQMTISGLIVRATVRQQFKNDGASERKASMSFRHPAAGHVSSLRRDDSRWAAPVCGDGGLNRGRWFLQQCAIQPARW